MNARDPLVPAVEVATPAERIEALDWEQLAVELDAQGSAVIPGLLAPPECAARARRAAARRERHHGDL